jgi:hypothetical protein
MQSPAMRTLFAVLLFVPVACGDDATAADAATGDGQNVHPDAAPGPDAPADAAPAPDAPPAIAVHGIVYDLDPQLGAANQPPLAGANVCLAKPAGACMLTGADGRFTLSAPENAGLQLTIFGTGHARLLWLGASLTADLDVEILDPKDADATTFFAACGATWPDAQKSAIWFTVHDGAGGTLAGATGALIPAASGVGPCYMTSPMIHAAASSTNASGMAAYGATFSADGDVDLHIASAGLTCHTPGHHFDAPQPGNARVPLALDTLTVFDATCL